MEFSIYNIFLLLGGIGLFLYGINYMTGSLEAAAGDNLRVILEKTTKNKFVAFILGALLTAMIQSSGACGVMVIGFVNSALMGLSEAVFVMLGSNIGTTITAQIIAFKIDKIAAFILFAGAITYLFVKNKTARKVSSVVLGFGMLFFGIYVMGEAIDKLELSSVIAAFLNNFNNPLLSVLFGFVFTAIIQSSSASIGILQVLTFTMGSSLGLESVMYIILGMNIGACSPIVLSAFSGKRPAKRAALANIMTKVLGVVFFCLIIWIFPGYIDFVKGLSSGDVSRQIANFHLFFNIISSLICCPFVGLISKFLMKVLPDDKSKEETSKSFMFITPELLMTPAIAISQTKREILRMGKITNKNLNDALDAFLSFDDEKIDSVLEIEKTINFLNHQITGFMVQLNGKSLSAKDREKLGMMFHVVSDIERIGDHAENIAEYARIVHEHNVQFSEEGTAEVRNMIEKVREACALGYAIYENEKFELLPDITEKEEAIDNLQDQFTENHIKRLKEEKCSPRGGILFTDLVTDLERCADHAINIAFAINGEKVTAIKPKTTFVMSKGDIN